MISTLSRIVIFSLQVQPLSGGRQWERPIGEHLSFGRQRTKMDESCERKGEGWGRNKGRLKEPEHVVSWRWRLRFFWIKGSKGCIIAMIAQSFPNTNGAHVCTCCRCVCAWARFFLHCDTVRIAWSPCSGNTRCESLNAQKRGAHVQIGWLLAPATPLGHGTWRS